MGPGVNPRTHKCYPTGEKEGFEGSRLKIPPEALLGPEG